MNGQLTMTEHRLPSWDGTELFYRAWQPATPARQAILLFHRGHEHSGRWQEVVEGLALPDTALFAWDARGHGMSPGERGAADNLAVLVKDVDTFVRHISRTYRLPVADMAVVAHSVGAAVVAAWVHDYAPPLRALVLAVPAFRVKLYVPFAVPLLRLKQRLFGKSFVKSYVKARVLTHDAEQAARYHADEFIFRQIAVNILLDLHDTSTRVVRDAGSITVPTLLLAAGADWVVKLAAQREFFARLSSPVKEFELYPEFYHAIFHERGRQQPIARTRSFLARLFAQPAPAVSLLAADQRGWTKDEYDRLARPSTCPWWALQRLGMRTVGRLSRGIDLGWRAGFDSGVTLDYVYANQATGRTPLGRLIDRQYLNSIGWRGIRQRRAHLAQLLQATIARVHAEGRPVRILDIAAGPGRYVLDAMRQAGTVPVTALLRDYREANLAQGRKLAAVLGVTGATFALGDAFDPASLAGVQPAPTIGIVSGLYELFPDNAKVLMSLRGLAAALVPGGYLLYTNQPWHPQVEFIARVLTNREGQPWVMRRRTQAEMDELVRAAGFEKLEMEIDCWGIFSVSLARRPLAAGSGTA